MSGLAGIINAGQRLDCTSVLNAMMAPMQNEQYSCSTRHIVAEMDVYVGWNTAGNAVTESEMRLGERKDVALVLFGECFVDSETLLNCPHGGREVNTGDRGWLIDLYEEQGTTCFEKLNGVFGGVLIDERRNKAFLFNDRYGLGRIYWHEDNGTIYFASEAKALLRILPEVRAFDDQGVAEFLKYGCTLGSRTLFKGIKTLPPASLWQFEAGRCHKTAYFSPETWEIQPPLSVEDFQSEFQQTVSRVVPRYFKADSRIGISLTAGLDTRMLLACLPETSGDVVTYTFDGPTTETADSQLARQIAKVAALNHHVLRLGPDFFSDFQSHVDRTVYATDGCFGVTGAHEVYLNRLASQLARIRLSGNYGGEVLRQVSTFKPLGLSPELLDPQFAAISSSFDQTLDKEQPVTFAAFREIPWKLFAALRAGQSQLTIRCPYLDNEIVALAYRTPAKLRRSPKPAVRLIASKNADFVNIPTDMGLLGRCGAVEGILRQTTAKAACKLDYFTSEGLPSKLAFLDPVISGLGSALRIAGTHKYLGYRNWFRRELADYVSDAIAGARLRQSPFWNQKFLRTMVKDHISGRKNYTREINTVVTLAGVERLLLQWQPLIRDTGEPERQVCRQAVAVTA